jgi:DNA-directed RNA polymerase subunit RPC12/RpoP
LYFKKTFELIMNKKKEIVTCPACGSDNVTEVIYGMPVFSPELMKEIKIGTKKLGGCCVRNDSPDFICGNCGKEWKSIEKIGTE